MTPPPLPRHLGLSRRQSYDPLSTSSKLCKSLHLGTLPSPQFVHLPAGQRSVPATESSLRAIGGYRVHDSGIGEAKEGPRTPGGSLVIGSEVFGFGTFKGGAGAGGKGASGRWGDGRVGNEESEEQEGREWATKGFENGSGLASPAIGDQEFGLGGTSGKGDSNGSIAHPSINSYGLANGSRPSALSQVDDINAIERPSSTQSLLHSRAQSSTPLPTPSALSAGQGFNSPAYPSYSESTNGGGWQDSRGPTFGNFAAPSQETPSSAAADNDLSFGMRNLTMGGMADPSLAYLTQPRRTPSNNRSGSPYNGYPSSQGGQDRGGAAGATQYSSPYYAQQPPSSSYLQADPYAAYTDSYYNSTADQHVDAPTYAPQQQSYRPPHQQQQQRNQQPWNPEFSPFASRQSFSYPSMPSYALAPGTSFLTMSGDGNVAQQQAILLGRGMRSAVDYIAPGPGPQGGYGGYEYGGGRDGGVVRSPMLEEFRGNRHRSWELVDLVNHIVEFSGDQLGSRHIQTKLETATPEEKALVIEEILPNMLQLSTDVFANYVIQKFFEQATQAQRTAMASVLEGNVLALSLQMYGCRVVQKALESVLVDQQVRMVKELDGHVLRCARDAQSNHVVQRALDSVPTHLISFIPQACAGHVYALATHPYGCRVLQRIFENCDETVTRGLLEELHGFTKALIQDQYGNYVIQWVIEKGEKADKAVVISKIHSQVLMLAQQKFASNVIEKCIIHASDLERKKIIEEVLSPAPDGTSVVKAMLVHPYANYVMQKILDSAVGAQREALFTQTGIQLANLKKYSSNYSKHLLTIEKLLQTERLRTGGNY